MCWSRAPSRRPPTATRTIPYRRSHEPGAVLGAMALVVAKPRPVTVKAIDQVETLFVPRSAFMKLANQYPDLAARAASRIRRDSRGISAPSKSWGRRWDLRRAERSRIQKWAMTGTWSDGLALQPRAGLMISAPVEWAAMSAVDQMWSRRRPWSDGSQSWRAIAPPGVELLVVRDVLAHQIDPAVIAAEQRVERLGLDRRVADDVEQLLVAPDVVLVRGDVEIAADQLAVGGNAARRTRS